MMRRSAAVAGENQKEKKSKYNFVEFSPESHWNLAGVQRGCKGVVMADAGDVG